MAGAQQVSDIKNGERKMSTRTIKQIRAERRAKLPEVTADQLHALSYEDKASMLHYLIGWMQADPKFSEGLTLSYGMVKGIRYGEDD
jgi:hypothetical protein